MAEQKPALDESRLEKLTRFVQQYVQDGHAAGVGISAQRDGQVVFQCMQGFANVEAQVAFDENTRFRTASAVKAITSVAFMTLVEEGRCHLHEPVVRYIPEFANLKVMQLEGDEVKEVDCTMPMLVMHLLNHTAGFGYPLSPFLTPLDPVAKKLSEIYTERGVFNLPCDENHTTQYLIERLAACPLGHQPGTRFLYGLNTDVLGIIIERISGTTLEQFVQERIFTPLQMTRSCFTLSEDQWDDVAVLYEPNETNEPPLSPVSDGVQSRNFVTYHPHCYFRSPNVHKSGGGGLISTIADFNKFLNSCLASRLGAHFAPKVVSRRTMELMTSNTLGKIDHGMLAPAFGFGFGFSVATEPALVGSWKTAGTFGWGGVFGLDYFVDPTERITCIMVMQRFPTAYFDIRAKYQTLLYQALN